MIKVLCETMTSSYDISLRVKTMEYPNLESFKAEILKHYLKSAFHYLKRMKTCGMGYSTEIQMMDSGLDGCTQS